MSRWFVVFAVLGGCSSTPDEVDFDSFSGSAADFNECHCQYEDGSGQTGSDPSFQIACFGSGEVEAMSMFIVPGTSEPQGAELLLLAVQAEYHGGGTGQYGTLGTPHKDGVEIVHSIDGLDFSWPEQDTCSVDHGCIDPVLTTYHLAAGTAHMGKGACEDLELEVAAD